MGTEYRELGPLGRDHQGLPLDPEEITTRHLRAFQAHLLLPEDQGGAGKRTSTVCTRHDALKLFFGFLEEEDDLPNPMRRVQRPTEEEVTIQPLTEDQLAALIDTCRGKDFYDRRDMALVRMWVSTPARLSEIALLRVVGADGEPDVDPLAGMIYVMGKGRRPRQMALSPKACKAAIRYEKVREQHLNAASPFYWLSHKKERFTQSGIRQMIARRAREAGIGHVHPHQFRHTYATTFLDHGGTGPEGVTQRASSFSRRDAVMDLTTRSAVLSTNAADVALRVEALVRHLLRDVRVVPVLTPGPRTSSEVLRVRDATGRIVRTVDQSERRYTTVDLLTAETELLHRATSRQDADVARVPRHIVDQVLAANPTLDIDQVAMVRTLASSGAAVDVVVGKAGTGKSTALGAYRAALDAAGIPVIGVAPSATAAHQLAMSADITETATVDRLLVELDHRRRTLPSGGVVILDEAAMCSTRIRLALQRTVDAVDGKIVDVGDHRQIPSVDVGGGHYALAQRLGASVLGTNHRFRDPVYRDAAELLRDHHAATAVEVLRAQRAVSDRHATPVDAWTKMVDDWVADRDAGDRVLMLATERTTVAEINQLARAHLVARGEISRRYRSYRAPDGHRTIALALGDEIVMRRNQRLTQPDGTNVAVRNGMTGRVVSTRRRAITVDLDAAHRTPGGPAAITLPAGYVGEHVGYGYARTVDTAQGTTVDDSLFAPTTGSSAERAYVALSRGRLTNRIYATRDRGWIDALGRGRSHALAIDQTPRTQPHAAPDRGTPRRRTRPRSPHPARTRALDRRAHVHFQAWCIRRGHRHDDMSSTILHDLGFLTRSATHLVSADSDPFFIELQEVYYLSTSQPNNNDGSSPSIRGARL